MNLEHALHEIEDPVVGDSSARVEAGLLGPIQRQARVADLDDEQRPGGEGRVGVREGPAYDRHIRLGLGLVVERDGELHPDVRGRAEGLSQGFGDELDAQRMRAALGLPDDELAAEELESLARLEDAPVDQLVVLDPFPASSAGRCRAHGQRLPGESGSGQCLETETAPGNRPAATRTGSS